MRIAATMQRPLAWSMAKPINYPSVYMSEIYMALFLLVAGFYVGGNIGANDAANCIGTMVGARLLSFRKGALLMALFVILGGTLQGHRVMKTLGKGIVITSPEMYEHVHEAESPDDMQTYFPGGRLPDLAVLVALLSSGLLVTAATIARLPVSTSQAIVGGVAGVGVGVVGLQGTYFKVNVLFKILGCWVLSPLLTMILAYMMYTGLEILLSKTKALLWGKLLHYLVIASGCYVAFSLGANDVGNAIGPLLNKYPDHGVPLALLGGMAMAIGIFFFGRRVTDTVGKNISPLDLPGALAAQFTAAFGVHIFSMLAIPVSTSQAIVGAVVGVGLTKGVRRISARKITMIVAGWVLAPCSAALCAALLYRFLLAVIS